MKSVPKILLALLSLLVMFKAQAGELSPVHRNDEWPIARLVMACPTDLSRTGEMDGRTVVERVLSAQCLRKIKTSVEIYFQDDAGLMIDTEFVVVQRAAVIEVDGRPAMLRVDVNPTDGPGGPALGMVYIFHFVAAERPGVFTRQYRSMARPPLPAWALVLGAGPERTSKPAREE